MTNITTAFTPGPILTSFEGLPSGEDTIKPRGRLKFITINGIIPSLLGTDTMDIDWTATLPANFGYALEYVTASVQFPTIADTADYDDLGLLFLQTGQPLNGQLPTISLGMNALGVTQNSASFATKIWSPVDAYKSVIYNQEGNSPLVILRFMNVSGNVGAAGTFSAQANFLQFDITQCLHVDVNSPLPTRSV